MKASLKSLARDMKPGKAAPPPKAVAPEPPYPTAQTRVATRQISAHFNAADVQAFRILAAELDMDVQELLAQAINMIFERHGRPNRLAVTSGRRRKRDA